MGFRKNTPNGEDEIDEEELEKANGGTVTPADKLKAIAEIHAIILPTDIGKDGSKKIADE